MTVKYFGNKTSKNTKANAPALTDNDVERTLIQLSSTFRNVTANMEKAVKGTELYNYQVSFCYFTNEIEQGSRYMARFYIQECNNLISDIIKARKKERDAAASSN